MLRKATHNSENNLVLSKQDYEKSQHACHLPVVVAMVCTIFKDHRTTNIRNMVLARGNIFVQLSNGESLQGYLF